MESAKGERPLLLRLVTEGRYIEALQYLEECGVDESSGLPTLHQLVQMFNPAPEAIAVADSICNKLPHLVTTRYKEETLMEVCISSRKVWTPATKQYQNYPRCAAMALTLIRANPAAVTTKSYTQVDSSRFCYVQRRHIIEKVTVTKTMFHLACEADADVTVLKAMLEVDPLLASTLVSAQVGRKSPLDLLCSANKSAIDKMALILLTQFEGRVVDPLPMHHLLHAACSKPCPWECFSRILDLYSTQAFQQDSRGSLPLHYAARNSSLEFQRLQQNHGVIQKLVEANPEALRTRDAATGLVPALEAASRSSQFDKYQLSVTYELLLAAPEIVLEARLSPTGIMACQDHYESQQKDST